MPFKTQPNATKDVKRKPVYTHTNIVATKYFTNKTLKTRSLFKFRLITHDEARLKKYSNKSSVVPLAQHKPLV